MSVRQFQVVGRKAPTEQEPEPPIYRMRVFAANEVTAKSRFWYYLHKLQKLKKTTGEILAVNEIRERDTRHVKNYGIWLRYNSRSGTHNMYKEFRSTSLCDAVASLYQDMNGRHRARERSIQIIKTSVLKPSECKRPNVVQFHDSKISFPITHYVPRASSRKFHTTFKANRPSTFMG